MRISLCNEVIRELPFERQCVFARQVGYDGLEIAPFTLGDEPHLLPPRGGPSCAAGRRRRHRHHRPALPDAHTGGPLDHLGRRRAARPHHRRDAAALRPGGRPRREHPGARLAGPAPARARQGGRGPQVGRGVLRRRRRGRGKAGVVYCIEPLARPENFFINTVEEAAAIVRAIDSPALRTMVDCCAAGRTEPPPIPELLAKWLPTGLIAHSISTTPTAAAPAKASSPSPRSCRRWLRMRYQGIAAIEPFVYEPTAPPAPRAPSATFGA